VTRVPAQETWLIQYGDEDVSIAGIREGDPTMMPQRY
jgi:hypothetical protein